MNNNVPTLQISAGTTISPGSATTLTITANQAPVQNIQVSLNLLGSAEAGVDYDPVDPVVTLDAGSTSATVTIDTLDDKVSNRPSTSWRPSPLFLVQRRGSEARP